MSAYPSSLPPTSFAPPSRRSLDDALAEAFASSDVLMPPPPEEGAIPEWHLATGVKPLRPLPQDLTDTMHMRRSEHTATEPPPNRTGPRVKRPRAKTRPSRVSGRHLKRPRDWAVQAAGMLLLAVLVGTLAGALFEHLTRMLAGA